MLLLQRQMYRVTDDSPEVIDSESAGITPRHLIQIQSMYSRKLEISNVVAKVSLYNVTDVQLKLHSRILSSTLELSNCAKVSIEILSDPPEVIQIDPDVDGLDVTFASSSPTSPAFIVSPRSSSTGDIGFKDVSVNGYVLINKVGIIADALLISSRGEQAEQYKIFRVEDKWEMRAVDKKLGVKTL